MNAVGEVDPKTPVDFVELVLIMHRLTVDAWADGQPRPPLDDAPVTVRRDPSALFDVLERYLDHPALGALREAWAASDVGAADVVAHLHHDSEKILPTLIKRSNHLYTTGDFRLLTREARFTGDLAAATGHDDTAVSAYIVAARGAWRVHDLNATVKLYESAIKIGEQCRPLPAAALSICHDNLGLAFTNLGRDDEAIPHFQRALNLEHDPTAMHQIRSNMATVFQSLGHYRRACRIHEESVAALRRSGVTGTLLGIALDNWASAVANSGDPETASELLERAATTIAEQDLEARLLNSQSRAELHRMQGNVKGAARAFVEAHDVAFQIAHASMDADHFRWGYRRALAARLPRSSDAWALFVDGLRLKDQVEWTAAADHLTAAGDAARQAGDDILWLRAFANAAATLAEAQLTDEAVQLCEFVRAAANRLGLAAPMSMVIGTRVGILQGGSDTADRRGVLALIAEALVLNGIHTEIVAREPLAADDFERVPVQVGALYAELAEQAAYHCANDLAVTYYRTAIADAQACGNVFGELNRMVGLLAVLDRTRPDTATESEEVAAELVARVVRPDVPGRAELVVRRALAAHVGDQDPTKAIEHERIAAQRLEELRAIQRAGPARAALDREYAVHRYLARHLLAAGAPAGEAWETLQGDRARRLMETLTARGGDEAPYRPPNVVEAQALLSRLGTPTTLVDVVLTKTGLVAYLLDAEDVRAVPVPGDPAALRRGLWGDVETQAARTVRLVAENPLLADLAAAVTEAMSPGHSVLLVVDDELANLPLHAAPLGAAPWCDSVCIGRLPAVGALRFTSRERPWAGRALVAGDSNSDLPGAAEECVQVARSLGVTNLVGRDCTIVAVRDRLTGSDLDVVHLALHGQADARRGGRASLLFADDRGGTAWVAFDELAQLPWRADLIVFSGCSTAVGGPRNGTGLYGVAQAAAEAGAVSIIASLWPVHDHSAKVFMIAFYAELRSRIQAGGTVDLRRVMDHARNELRRLLFSGPSGPRRDGRTLILDDAPADDPPSPRSEVSAAMLHWAPFVLLGDPLLTVGPAHPRLTC